MPVLREEHEVELYDSLVFVEFLEFVARVAEVRYSAEVDLEDEPLVTKCEYLLDCLLAWVGLERQELLSVAEDTSDSDDEYRC